MLTLSCLCGQLRITIERLPDHVNACNCTLCSKTGAYWGYFHPSAVHVEGAAGGYSRDDKADPAARIRFCGVCGVTTHFGLTPSAVARFGDGVIGVNMRLADERDLFGIELRYPDGRAWSGEGAFGYVRAARLIGREDPSTSPRT